MKKFLTHKFLPILALFLLILNVFVVSSFGADYNTIDGTLTLSDELSSFKYICLYRVEGKTSSGKHPYGLTVSNYPFEVTEHGFKSDTYAFYMFYIWGKYDYYQFKYNLSDFSSLTLSDASYHTTELAGMYLDNVYDNIVFSTFDIYRYDTKDLVHNADAPIFNAPSFITTEEELCSGKFDTLRIDAGDLDLYSDEFGLAIADVTTTPITGVPTKFLKTFVLNSQSEYFRSADLQVYYDIPQPSLQLDFSNGKKYMFCLVNLEDYSIYNSVTFEVRWSY